ncbi:lycopene cyclase domain-containing protein [Agromyces sp. Marseille-Q5079]|uniref:lycopene cyclase domain-containing protein n=1 Tax=Agromyces sp. Marseille-Q5079 TaxID=3439059 RepID=UPI003D9CA63B
MTYLLICIPFLVASAAVAVVSTVRMPRVARRRRWLALGVAAVVLVALTAVFDSIMIAARLLAYPDGTRLGATIGLAPIEDFATPIGPGPRAPGVSPRASRRPPATTATATATEEGTR